MAITIEQALETARAGSRRKCRVGRFLEELDPSDAASVEEMLTLISAYKVYAILLTVDGMTKDILPSRYAIRTHQRGECSCQA